MSDRPIRPLSHGTRPRLFSHPLSNIPRANFSSGWAFRGAQRSNFSNSPVRTDLRPRTKRVSRDWRSGCGCDRFRIAAGGKSLPTAFAYGRRLLFDFVIHRKCTRANRHVFRSRECRSHRLVEFGWEKVTASRNLLPGHNAPRTHASTECQRKPHARSLDGTTHARTFHAQAHSSAAATAPPRRAHLEKASFRLRSTTCAS